MGRQKNVPRKILILLDSPEVRGEVTTYSVELARRMGAELCLLMLLRWPPPSVDEVSAGDGAHKGLSVKRRGELAVKGCLNEIHALGLGAVGAVRQGDPPSELLKYLAEHRPFQAVVWGGNERFLRRGHQPVRSHWLVRIREELECTLVVPSLRRSRAGSG